MTKRERAEKAETLISQLRSVLAMVERRGRCQMEQFEVEMLKRSIAAYDGFKSAPVAGGAA